MSDETLPGDYRAEDIVVLRHAEAVRRRPAMYVGSLDSRGLHFLLGEVLEEFVEQGARRLAVELLPGGVRIRADGTALSLPPEALERVFTQVGCARSPWRHLYFVATCALAARLLLEVQRGGRCWRAEFSRGKVTHPALDAGPAEQPRAELTFWPDPDIFGKATFSAPWVRQRLREQAFLTSGLLASLQDTSDPEPERFHAQDGVIDFVRRINRHHSPLHTILHDRDTSGTTTLEVALQWTDFPGEDVRCYANAGSLHRAGTHVTGLRAALTRFFRARWPAGRDVPTGEALRVGLTAVVAVNLEDPLFAGQMKTRLNNPELEGMTDSLVTRCLENFQRSCPAEYNTLLDYLAERASRRPPDPKTGQP
jgi:DNA gyrase subunit B